MNENPSQENKYTTLEDQDTTVQSVGVDSSTDRISTAAPNPGSYETVYLTKKPNKTGLRTRMLLSHVNVYLLLFILIFVISLGLIFVSIQQNKQASKPNSVTTQSLTPQALDQLRVTDTRIGDPKQTLSIESNTIFSGKILARDSLDIAGAVKIGGSTDTVNLIAAGTSNFDLVQAKNIAIAENLTVGGQITVTGTANFSGQLSAARLTVQTLQLNGDLQFNRHIDAGGGTPGRSDGASIGSGGSSSVSGTDTAGTVTISTGSNASAGCLTTVNFAQRFTSTPHVVITPVGAESANINYYVNRTDTGFSVCSTNSPSRATYTFDYIIID